MSVSVNAMYCSRIRLCVSSAPHGLLPAEDGRYTDSHIMPILEHNITIINRIHIDVGSTTLK
jgi:hypothetical protein